MKNKWCKPIEKELGVISRSPLSHKTPEEGTSCKTKPILVPFSNDLNAPRFIPVPRA
jgi:hypothetical protein